MRQDSATSPDPRRQAYADLVAPHLDGLIDLMTGRIELEA